MFRVWAMMTQGDEGRDVIKSAYTECGLAVLWPVREARMSECQAWPAVEALSGTLPLAGALSPPYAAARGPRGRKEHG